MRLVGGTLTGAGIVLAALACGSGSSAPHSTLDGVYSAEQATHGKEIYAAMCASCHAAMNNHTGPVFRTRWAGATLLQLVGYVTDNMPKNDPGSLSADDYRSVVAYLLQLNDMPAGKTALPVDTVRLKAIIYDTIAAKP